MIFNQTNNNSGNVIVHLQNGGTMEIWEPSTRNLVCPVDCHRDSASDFMLKMEQIGAADVTEITMPFRFPHTRFFRGVLPEWLDHEPDEESEYAGFWDFKDRKGRMRLRSIVGGVSAGTTFFATRYKPDAFRMDRSADLYEQRPFVVDREGIPTDDADEGAIIWEGTPDDLRGDVFNPVDAAVEWLDANKPLWRNPVAYWS